MDRKGNGPFCVLFWDPFTNENSRRLGNFELYDLLGELDQIMEIDMR